MGLLTYDSIQLIAGIRALPSSLCEIEVNAMDDPKENHEKIRRGFGYDHPDDNWEVFNEDQKRLYRLMKLSPGKDYTDGKRTAMKQLFGQRIWTTTNDFKEESGRTWKPTNPTLLHIQHGLPLIHL